MPKISELVPDEMLGKVKLTTKYNQSGYWFIPYFKDKDGFYHGLNSFNEYLRYSPDEGWILFSSPKPKVKRWLWAARDGAGDYFMTSIFMSDEEMCTCQYNDAVKLEWSEQEFDE